MTRPARRIQPLKLGSAAQILPVVFGSGAQLLTTPYVVYRLGIHDFGVWSITGAIAQYAALLDLGISRAVNRYVTLFNAKGDTKGEGAVVGICLTALVLLGVLLSGVAFASSGSMDRILGTGDPELARLLLLSAVSMMVVGLIARVLAAASVGRGRYFASGIGVAILSILQAGVVSPLLR